MTDSETKSWSPLVSTPQLPKMVPIDTGTRVYQEMYGASGDEVLETAKVCHMEPVRFDTRGYTGNVL